MYYLWMFLLCSAMDAWCMQEARESITLAINVSNSSCVAKFLQITFPENFKQVSAEMAPLKEYVKKSNIDQSLWLERITTHTHHTHPADILLKLKNAIISQATDVKVLYCSIEQVDAHMLTIATALISYVKGIKKRMVYARFIGEILQPVCSGFKYTVDTTHKNNRDVIKQLKEFAEEQTRIVVYGGNRN